MTGHGLSRSERRALTAIERTLRTDERFQRLMAVGADLFCEDRPSPERAPHQGRPDVARRPGGHPWGRAPHTAEPRTADPYPAESRPAVPHAAQPRAAEPHSRLTRAVCASVVLSLVLLPLAAATSSPALICAFAISYAVTLAGLAVLVRRWCGRCR
ncbi:hypothetical protein AB0D45_12550 [Streptomyces sp. NPDC048352]|uniref:hypothetical protein n=1 Tax=Streptomyces sp. NPDC048352 TaxID=3154718 RepID=UPI00342526B3